MEKLDINQKFNSILLNNKITKETSYNNAIKIIKDLEKESLLGKKIGLYGVGIEAEGLLSFIFSYTDQLKIDVCFDKTIRHYKYKDRIRNTSVNKIEFITSLDVDYLILGSYEYKEVFLDNLSSIGYRGNVINLYEYLDEYKHEHYADYKILFQTKQAYREADGKDKIRLLQKLIKEYLLLKDFISAAYYMDYYISMKYMEYNIYVKLKREINQLLEEIKGHIKERKKRDIIINWVDALSYYDIPKFPFLKNVSEKGVFFKNTYTVMPWTTETLKTILFGEYPIEGKLFLREFFSSENAKLLTILDSYGYKFGYCGMSKYAKLFDNNVIIRKNYFENKYAGSMQKQWDALDVLCKTEEPVCILIHTLRETHEPFICGECNELHWFGSSERDWEQEICQMQAEISGTYINNQLEFYEKFYHGNAIEIYLSDHGRIGNNPMNDNKIHTILMVSGDEINSCCIDSMMSLVKFPALINKILQEETDWNALTEDYIIIENLDAYNELVVRDTLSGKLSREEMHQCRGIVTKSDSYYLYASGKEYYFDRMDSKQNKIGTSNYQERIKCLKHLCGDEFIDIYKYEKFKYSRQLYIDETDTNLVSCIT